MSTYIFLTITDMFTTRETRMNFLSVLLLASMMAESSQLTCQSDLRRPGTVSFLYVMQVLIKLISAFMELLASYNL